MQYKGNKPKFLDALVKSSKLTQDGRDWLTLALDPFHDYEHPVAGYPDADGSQTIVSCYTYQLDVAKPAGVVGNWDCHVFTTPMMTSTAQTIATVAATWLNVIEGAQLANVGPLTIHAGASGASVFPGAVGAESKVLPPVGSTNLISGITRVIGMGYEVTNTTSALNKQGAVTSYRTPQYLDGLGQISLSNAAATVKGVVATRRYRAAPDSIAEANLLKGTRTWDAAEGVYAVAVQNSQQNPMKLAENAMCLATKYSYPGVAELQPISSFSTTVINAAPALSALVPSLTQLSPFDTTGSYFTGLSPETTLTVKLRVYVERAPSFTDSDLSVLATPSAGLDEMAMTLYSHAVSQLPVAVTVKENGIGDWFRGVVNVLKDVAGSAGTFINPIFPGAAQMGNAISTVMGGIANAIPGKKQVPRPLANVKTALVKYVQNKDAQKIANAIGRIKQRKSFASN